MTLKRFLRLLETFGADFRRWPDSDRAGARALHEHSPEAQRHWRAARRLDDLFRLERETDADEPRSTARGPRGSASGTPGPAVAPGELSGGATDPTGRVTQATIRLAGSAIQPIESPDRKTDAMIIDAALRRIRAVREPPSAWRWLFAGPMRAAFATIVVAGLLAGYLTGPTLLTGRTEGVPAVSLLLGFGGPDVEGFL
jgi:hypothetical protein